MKVKDLKANNNASVRVRICAQQPIRNVQSKKGYNLKVCSFLVGDDTGTVEFSAFGKDIYGLQKNVTKIIDIKDGWVKEWNGKLQMSLGRSGTWELVEDPDPEFPLVSEIMKANTE